MKNITLIISSVIFMVLITFSSCKKDRNCTCVWESNLPAPNPPSQSGTDIIPKGILSESEAIDSCNAIQKTYDDNAYYPSATCSM